MSKTSYLSQLKRKVRIIMLFINWEILLELVLLMVKKCWIFSILLILVLIFLSSLHIWTRGKILKGHRGIKISWIQPNLMKRPHSIGKPMETQMLLKRGHSISIIKAYSYYQFTFIFIYYHIFILFYHYIITISYYYIIFINRTLWQPILL